MKKLSLSFIILACLLTAACKKHTYDEALPVVQFVSASPLGNDSIIVTGRVVSQGADAVQYVGFAYSDQPNFDILCNQVLGNGVIGDFSTALLAIQNSTYYIKCFAANSFGYVASANFKYVVPSASPQTAPCSVNNNTLIDANFSYSMTYISTDNISPSYGSFGVEADNGVNETVSIYFKAAPTNGIYTTAADPTDFDFDSNPYDCVVEVNNNYLVNPGGKVYIAHNGSHVTVSFCSLGYEAYSSNFTISAKITY